MAEAKPTTPCTSLLPVAVGLARCSGEDQEHSVADQRAEITSWARENGKQLLEVFEDEAISGSELDRPGVRQLLAFLDSTPEKGTLVIWKRNRLARPDDPRDALFLERRIEQAGWAIHYLHGAQTSGNALMDTLMSAIEFHHSGEFLRSLATDVLRGQLRRALEGGLLMGVAPYGFARHVTSPSGATRTVPRQERYRRAPGETVRWVAGDPREVETVRRLFERFATEKVSHVSLAGELNADSIPSPRGQVWVSSTVQSILRNPTYVGEFAWNRHTSARFCRLIGQKPKLRTKGDGPKVQKTAVKDQVRIKRHHPALIDQVLFDKVQEIMARRAKRKGGGRHVRQSHPLSRRVFCLHCGSSMTATRFSKRGTVYCCSGYRQARICKCYLVLAETLERAVLKKLKEIVVPSMQPGLRVRVLDVLKNRRRCNTPATSVKQLEKDRKSLEVRISRALDNMGVVGSEVAGQIAGRIEEWTAQRRDLEQAIARAQEREVVEVDLQQSADGVVSLLKEIAESREDASREDLASLFRKTVERVDLEFAVDPAKAHRKKGRHSCMGGQIVLTSFFEEATHGLLGDEFLVKHPG